MKNLLVSTADEKSWDTDTPLLFLGEWCKRYDRSHVWSKVEHVVAEPLLISENEEEGVHAYLKLERETLLKEVALLLNTYHGEHHDEKYWYIILGHWLQRFCNVIYNRYNVLHNALNNYEVDNYKAYSFKDYLLATRSTYDFTSAYNDDRWNNILFAKIIALTTELQITQLNEENLPGYFDTAVAQTQVIASPFKRVLLDWATRISKVGVRKSDAFIINTYLPKKLELMLQLSFFQLPKVWGAASFNGPSPELEKRSNLSLNFERHQGFERLIRQLLPEAIPACFIEGYTQLKKAAASQGWPTNPKFIFTSNNFDTDEVFKVYTAEKTESGISYIVGQHGNYQCNKLAKTWPETNTPDKFITWGLCDIGSKSLPGFNFKVAGRSEENYDPRGGLLLIETTHPYWQGPSDLYHQYSNYQEAQYSFVETLDKSIQDNLVVRFHSQTKNLNWSEELRWKDRGLNIQMEMGIRHIRDLIGESRLVVHSYDSTGILETLSLNIPTISFWQNGFAHLDSEHHAYYQELLEANIIFVCPEKAAKHINDIWDDVDAWWESKKVQDARGAFCNQFSRKVKSPVLFLRNLLTQTIN